MAEAQSELALIARHLAEQYPKSNNGLTMRVHRLQEELVGDVGTTLWLLLSAVGLVLLMSCVNIASLLLTRAISRSICSRRGSASSRPSWLAPRTARRTS